MPAETVTSADFREKIADGITLVDFYTPTCGPCRMMTPILEECSEFVRVLKIDASKDLDLSAEFGVRAVPTLIFFKDGVEAKRMVGVQSKHELKKLLGEIQL